MKQEHLSPFQIEELIINGPGLGCRSDSDTTETRDAWLHLEKCELCRSSKEELDEFVRLYRDSALVEAGAAEVRAFSSAPPAPLSLWNLWTVAKWGLAFILLLAVFTPILLQRQRGVPPQSPRNAAAQIASDNLLLEKVDQEVNDSVPQPLQSLTDLTPDGSGAN